MSQNKIPQQKVILSGLHFLREVYKVKHKDRKINTESFIYLKEQSKMFTFERKMFATSRTLTHSESKILLCST